ncbi:hypothetical protein B0T10DRAFT_39109 [Thelonectria olida]|uniref:Uncharacterized protein n=1 Tax=Thelonectria olida TaxID=1576542 RepID=A0A9P8W4Y1_9HYPO|nr:hypothetical protein B0T10DRAFT_39109 [Thelonectria olida]
MKFASLVLFLVVGSSHAAVWSTPTTPSSSSCKSILVTTEKTTVTVDWVSTSTITQPAEAPSPSSPVVPQTTVCTQKCVVLTLSTAIKPTSDSGSWSSSVDSVPPAAPHVTVSCLTIYDTTSGYSEEATSWHFSPSIPISVAGSSSASTTGSSLGSSESVVLSTWEPSSLATSPVASSFVSSVTITASSSSPTSHVEEGSSIVSTSEPCSTDVTVTKTFVETLWTSAPVTTTLVTTRAVTITTVVVETYSTSTGGKVVPATRTTTATIVSVHVGCTTATTLGVEASDSPESSIVEVTPVPETTESLTGRTTISTAVTTISTPLTTIDNASTSTAGAAVAAVNAGVGLGALVGLMAVLA